VGHLFIIIVEKTIAEDFMAPWAAWQKISCL